MTDSLPPAPLWRRFMAAAYDALLLLALWMVTVLLDVLIRDALGLARDWTVLRVGLFGIGLAFFGWFWTHGGQTLGMRVWRLRLQADADGRFGWRRAAVRYALMMLVWGIVLTPLAAQAPRLREEPHAALATAVCAALALLALAGMLVDPRRRAPQDWLSGSRLVLLPKPPKA